MRITPIRTGTIHCNKTVITLGRDFDQWIDIPATAWLVETPQHRLLVDTGMCDSARAEAYHYAGSCQQAGERIDEALLALGFGVEDIDHVIFTHLHWDHCANCHRFTKAQFHVQAKEFAFARAPIPPYFHSYEVEAIGLQPPFHTIELCLLEGDQDIVPGVRVITTPGHSPGHQSVVVGTERGRFVIAGDAILSYENLEPDPKKGARFRMIGRYMDFVQAWHSFEKIIAVADYVLPGHDFRVFDKVSYP